MRTADLTGPLLDYWTARAEGVPAAEMEIREVPRTDWKICVRKLPERDPIIGPDEVALRYSSHWAFGGPLVEKHMPELNWVVDPIEWYAEIGGGFNPARGEGSTPLIAICRAVVRAAFGDEVEDLPC